MPSLGEMFGGEVVVGGSGLATTLFHAVVVDFGDVGAWVGESDIALAKVGRDRFRARQRHKLLTRPDFRTGNSSIRSDPENFSSLWSR